jgi:two-component system sensor histidine kinase RpfC
VKSEEGHGSTFCVKLPLLSGAVSPPPVAPAVLRGAHALVFEQNAQSAEAIVEVCEAAGMQAEAVSSIDQLGDLHNEPKADERRLVLVVDAPRGIDLERAGALTRKLLGADTPLVYLHYPRRNPGVSDPAAGRAFKPVNAVQLWQAMATVVAPGLPDAHSASPVPSDRQRGNNVGRVLVAEDDNINGKLIDSLLRQAGCDVTLKRDGEAAFDAASAKGFDLAFVDLRMPRMDGIGFARAYRAQEPAGQHLPIVAITADAAEDARAECLRAGMDEFVTKPVDPQVLQELLLRYGLIGDRP